MMMPWLYDPGEKRKKHKWNESLPGFDVEQGMRVGKCPGTLTTEDAQELLNTGVEWYNPNLDWDYPHHIYNVHQGAIYKGAVTVHVISYHGFPYEGRIPRSVKDKLREIADQKNCRAELEKWLKQYITP